MKIHEILSPRIEEKISEYSEMEDHLEKKSKHFEQERNTLFIQYISSFPNIKKMNISNQHLNYLVFEVLDLIVREKEIGLSSDFLTNIANRYRSYGSISPSSFISDEYDDYKFTITYPTYSKHVAKLTKKKVLVYGMNEQHAEIGKKFIEVALTYEKSFNEACNLAKAMQQLRKSYKHIVRHLD